MHFVNILRKTHVHDAVSDMLAAPASADTDPGPVMIPSILQKRGLFNSKSRLTFLKNTTF